MLLTEKPPFFWYCVLFMLLCICPLSHSPPTYRLWQYHCIFGFSCVAASPYVFYVQGENLRSPFLLNSLEILIFRLMSAEGFLFVKICICKTMTSHFLLLLGKPFSKQNTSFLHGHQLCQVLSDTYFMFFSPDWICSFQNNLLKDTFFPHPHPQGN